QILRGIPYFFLTRSDQCAVVIQYLSSQMWGSGPLWRCTRDFKLYGVVKQEFRTLWELNSPLPPPEAGEHGILSRRPGSCLSMWGQACDFAILINHISGRQALRAGMIRPALRAS